MAENMIFPLLDLSDELIISVVEALADDKKTLVRLAQTCSHLRDIAEPYVYRDITLRGATEAVKIIHSMKAREQRLSAVHRLDNRLEFRPKTPSETSNINHLIQSLTNLRHWAIESPYANYHRWNHQGSEWIDQDMRDIVQSFVNASPMAPVQPKPLSLLQSCE